MIALCQGRQDLFDPRLRKGRLTYQGETLTIPEWAERLGMSDKLIGRRIWVGWSVEAALTTPPLRRGLRAR